MQIVENQTISSVMIAKPSMPHLLKFFHFPLLILTSTFSIKQFKSTNPILSSQMTKKDHACVIKEALSKALVYYYPLAGKLTAHNNGRLEGIDDPTAQKLVFDNPSQDQTSPHPLVFKVTKFLCGGFTIGMGLSHCVCDGFGALDVCFYR
jgi:spermidine dicoumaroyl transferase